MPSNDERREVAKGIRSDDAFWHVMKKDIDTYRHYLADLIEPEPERTCRMELRKRGATYDVFYFDCCDEEYSESRTDQYASGISGRVCPYCGAKVVER